jgi:YD repeat-containing protein
MVPGTRAAVSVAVTVCALTIAVLAANTDVGKRGTAFANDHLAVVGSAAPPHGRELPGLRTRRSRTFVRPAGHGRVTQVFSEPIHYRDHGAWRTIDNSLHAASGASLTNGQNRFDLRLPARLDGAAPSLSLGDDSISFRLLGADEAVADVDGETATYDDVRRGVDLSYEAVANGVKETLVLAGRNSPNRFRFALELSPGLRPRLRKSGAIDIVEAGTRRFTVPAPRMSDSAAAPTTSLAVHYDLVAVSKRRWNLIVTASRSWLNAPARVWPVRVDPSVVLPVSDYGDCQIIEGDPLGCVNTSLRVGTLESSSTEYRSLVRFDVASAVPAGSAVLDADVMLHEKVDYGVDQSASVGAYRLLTPWEGWDYRTSWQSPNGGASPWTSPGGDYDPTPLDTNESGVGGGSFNVTGQVQRWLDGADPNYGLILVEIDSGSASSVGLTGYASSYDDMALPEPVLQIAYMPPTDGLGERDKNQYDRVGVNDRTSVSVNVANGNLLVSAQDLSINGVGLGLDVTRTYNGLSEDLTGPIGPRWTLSAVGGVNKLASGDRIYTAPSGYHVVFRQISTGVWQTPPGIDATYEAGAFGERLTFHDTGEKLYFDAAGHLARDEDQNGSHIDYVYTAGRLTSIIDSQGRTHSLAYAASGKLDTMTDSAGRVTDYNNAVDGSLTSVVDTAAKTTTYAYFPDGRLKTVTDPRGNDVKLTYDTAGRVTSVTRVVDGTAANDVTRTYSYGGPTVPCTMAGATGKTIAIDPRGKIKTYCWDSNGLIVASFDDDSNKTAIEYTDNADIDSVTDTPAGASTSAVTDYEYDTAGTNPTNNLESSELPQGETATSGYCGDPGLPGCSSSDPLDEFRPLKETDADGTDQFFVYDGAGNVTAVKDDATTPRNQATIVYTNHTTDPTLPEGLVKSVTDGEAHQTTYEYFTNGSLKKVTPPMTTGPGAAIGPTQYTYDSLGRLATMTDGRGKVQTLTHDGADRVTRIDVSDGSWFVMTFDGNGNLTQRQDSAGRTTTYTYDKLNRVLTETFPGARTNTYTYDKADNVKTITDGGGTTTYSYDDIDRVTSIVAPNAAGTGTDTITYTYDDTVSPSKTTITVPGGARQVTYTDSSGKPAKIEVLNSTGTVLSRLTYSYTAATAPSNRSRVQSITTLPGNKTTYGYADAVEDVARLLKATTRTGAGAFINEYRYTYDKAGNRTKKQFEAPLGTTATTTYAYNAANQLCWRFTGTSTNGCGTPPAGATSYAYDAAGNQTTGSGGTYDAIGRTSALTGCATLTYLTPTQDDLIGCGTTSYQNNTLGLSRVFAPTTTTDIIRAPGGTPVSQRVSGAKRYLLNDHLGSIVGLLDSAGSGSIARTYTYDPDGNATTAGTGWAASSGSPADTARRDRCTTSALAGMTRRPRAGRSPIRPTGARSWPGRTGTRTRMATP